MYLLVIHWEPMCLTQICNICAILGTNFDPKAVAGRYELTYSTGNTDNTTVECDGTVTWLGNTITDQLYPAGSGLPENRAAQNSDPNYQAEDGWYFRIWERDTAWEFVRFSDGHMTIRHFCAERTRCPGESPEGSSQYYSGAKTRRQPFKCSGKQ